MLAGLIKEKAK